MDVVVVAQHVFQLHQNTFAFRWRNVGDGYVAGEGVALRAEAPHVEVVNVDDAFNGLHAGADLVDLNAARSSFEKDVEGFANNVDAGPEDECGNNEREDGVDPGMSGEEDGCASDDDGGGGECVSGHVEEGAAHVDVARDTPEEGGDDAVHDDAGGGDNHHQARLDSDGSTEAVDGFDADPDGDDDESGGIDEGGKDSRSLVAEGFGVVGGPGLEVDGGEAEEQGQKVRGVVAGF